MALLERLAATGTPLVVVVFAGRPLVLGGVLEHAHAVLYAWHPGTMGGPAIVDVLFGDESPSGRLPVTFPRAVGQIPIYHAYKNTGRPPTTGCRGIPPGTPLDPEGFETSHLDLEVSPEFPFGFGMSYATFKHSQLEVEPATAAVGTSVRVRVTVENTSERLGDEVVQIYVRDLVGSVTRPVRELKAFRRVRLEPGQRRRVEVQLEASAFEFVGQDLERRIEPGRFHIFVGGDSTADLCAELVLT
jgi:beta-glucosidase